MCDDHFYNNNNRSNVLKYIPASTLPSNASPSSSPSGLSSGAVAGIVIAVLFVVAIVGWIIYLATRRVSYC